MASLLSRGSRPAFRGGVLMVSLGLALGAAILVVGDVPGWLPAWYALAVALYSLAKDWALLAAWREVAVIRGVWGGRRG